MNHHAPTLAAAACILALTATAAHAQSTGPAVYPQGAAADCTRAILPTVTTFRASPDHLLNAPVGFIDVPENTFPPGPAHWTLAHPERFPLAVAPSHGMLSVRTWLQPGTYETTLTLTRGRCTDSTRLRLLVTAENRPTLLVSVEDTVEVLTAEETVEVLPECRGRIGTGPLLRYAGQQAGEVVGRIRTRGWPAGTPRAALITPDATGLVAVDPDTGVVWLTRTPAATDPEHTTFEVSLTQADCARTATLRLEHADFDTPRLRAHVIDVPYDLHQGAPAPGLVIATLDPPAWPAHGPTPGFTTQPTRGFHVRLETGFAIDRETGEVTLVRALDPSVNHVLNAEFEVPKAAGVYLVRFTPDGA